MPEPDSASGSGIALSGDEVRGNRYLVDHDHGTRGLRRAATPALDGDDHAVDDELAAPHAVDLCPLERAGQARIGEPALLADRLRAGDVELVLREEQMRERSVTVGAAGVAGSDCD